MGRDGISVAFASALGFACAALGPAPASAQDASADLVDTPPVAIPHTQPSANDLNRVLDMQNAERARLGLPPLAWSDKLASDAGTWAKVLLQRGEPDHSPASERRGQGENLWMGTEGTWKADAMVEMFLDERQFFRAAPFPDVSSTGNWIDVGHYSQIVWRETKQVGCALANGNGLDVLVCRYLPAGNVHGEKPY